MNRSKASELDYINFLVASPKVYSCAEAGRVQPAGMDTPAHDAMTRLLHRLDPDPARLWAEAAQHVVLDAGLLIIDDTTLDKPYARQIALVRRHWSGKHHRVVHGSNLVTLLWSAGTDAIPVTTACSTNQPMAPPSMITFRPCAQLPTPAALPPAWSPAIVGTAVWPTSS